LQRPKRRTEGALADERRLSVSGKALLPGRVDVAREIGIAYVPEDRHANGFCNNLSVEENIALPVLRRISRWGFVSKTRRRALANSLIARLDIKVSDPSQGVSELSAGTSRRPSWGAPSRLSPRFSFLNARLLASISHQSRHCSSVLATSAGTIVREITGSWKEHEMVAAMEGVA
jgi:simple sugar transport system ATP-binding protein